MTFRVPSCNPKNRTTSQALLNLSLVLFYKSRKMKSIFNLGDTTQEFWLKKVGLERQIRSKDVNRHLERSDTTEGNNTSVEDF